MDLAWWIAVIGVPLVGAIFSIDAVIHARASASANKCHERIDGVVQALNDYKLAAADKYATQQDAHQIETRIAASLARIDTKLDKIDERLTRKEMREISA